MSSDQSITSKLNAALQGPTTSSKQITAEDIAKCRGASQSFGAMALNQLKTAWRTGGKFVTDATIQRLLEKNGIDNSQTISDIFKNSAPTTEKDVKVAKDLAKIFEKAGKQYGKTNIQESAGETYILLSARQQLEKYDPASLLRASAFEAGRDTLGTTKEAFILFLEKNPPRDESHLKELYQEFITKNLNEKNLTSLKSMAKENAMEAYSIGMALTKSGIIPNKIMGAFEAKSGLESLESSRMKLFVHLEAIKKHDITPLGEILKEPRSEKVLAGLADQYQMRAEHDFLVAVTHHRNLPPEEQGESEKAIRKEFMNQGAPREANIPASARNNLDAAYTSVAKTYVSEMAGRPDFNEKLFNPTGNPVVQRPQEQKGAGAFSDLTNISLG